MAVLYQKWYFSARYHPTHTAGKILKLITLVHNQLRNNIVEFQKVNKSSRPVVLSRSWELEVTNHDRFNDISCVFVGITVERQIEIKP